MTLFDPPDPAPSSRASFRVRMLVAYDGSGFHGFAVQPGVRTVGGALTEAITKVVQAPVELTCAGRTDAGVHAWGQVVHVDVPEGTDLERLHRSLLKLLGPAIVVREVAVAAPDFDARFSARSRTYRYSVWNHPLPDPFSAHLAWHVPAPLERDLLDLACDPFLGEHDFSAFCRRPKVGPGEPPASLVRRVLAAGWERPRRGPPPVRDPGDRVLPPDGAIDRGNGRRRRPGDRPTRRHRRHPPQRTALQRRADRPGHGLCLWEVSY